jgi:hypothetical protein
MNRLVSSRRLGARAVFALVLLVLVAGARSAHAGPVLLSENFDNVAGLTASGWTLTNQSAPAGTTAWFQGNPGVFTAQSGAADAYIAANFAAADFGGNISLWLVSPVLTLQNNDLVSFYTRSEDPTFGDQLEVRLSAAGAASNTGSTASSVGTFSNLLLTLNANDPGAQPYPGAWTQYVLSVSGLSGPTAARLAFRYVVNDTSVNGDYIGIDSVAVEAVPEPSTLTLSVLGMLAGARKWRARRAGRA